VALSPGLIHHERRCDASPFRLSRGRLCRPRNCAGMERIMWEYAPFAIALLMLIGSLYLSIAMGLKACPLCLYQRTLVMGVVGVLGIGLMFRLSAGPDSLGLLTLPLAVAGFGLAAFHVYLEQSARAFSIAPRVSRAWGARQSRAWPAMCSCPLCLLSVLSPNRLRRGNPGQGVPAVASSASSSL
jgi:hypothetical protein